MKDLFRGKLVRLTSEEPGTLARLEASWRRDTEFHRYMDGDPSIVISEKRIKEWLETQNEGGHKPRIYRFNVRGLKEDKLIGFLGMWVDLVHGDAWVGLGIGEREFWGKGYGTDMMKLCLRYAFTELNLRRVTLALMDYNPRALRSYEKAGFRLEGRTRSDIQREGKHYDSLWMGILREEWEAMQKGDVQ